MNPSPVNTPSRRAQPPETISEIIAMALSDHVSFAQIYAQHGLKSDEVKTMMKRELKRGSYVAWWKRVRAFSARRAVYK